jgi:site-specific DNA-methyltransferase (adenine-specific)
MDKQTSNLHVPDILDTISNLSNDEVFTPPTIANAVLDLLPNEVWQNPDLKFLDPATKTGVFLREAAKRLMHGLAHVIEDEDERREHIFREMLFGFPITELTSLMSRRSLYYSKDASGEFSVVKFDDSQGNIPFLRLEHDEVNGKCSVCGAKTKDLERGTELENYAYRFIHDQEVEKMHFDVVIGNPPYQLKDGGGGKGSSASPIYQLFVNQAFRLKPTYVAMIIPARWFSGGKGLDDFRSQMLASKQFRDLVYYPDSAEVFPGPDFGGGVCYFLWDKEYSGKVKFKTIQSGAATSEVTRDLDEDGAVLVSHTDARPILAKIKSHGLPTLDLKVSSRKPFGFSGVNSLDDGYEGPRIQCLTSDGMKEIAAAQVTANHDWVQKFKVVVGKAYGERGSYPFKIIAKPRVLKPGQVCTETYLVLSVFENETAALRFAQYVETRFFRFLLGLQKNTQNITKDKFAFVPQLPDSWAPDDEKLYEAFQIDHEERVYIESLIRPMGGAEES